MDALDGAIREFIPDNGTWLPLDTLLDSVFSSSDPGRYYDAIFNLFERFRDDDGAGVFWSAVRGMEQVGGYELLLLQYFLRKPALMTCVMLRRILNSGQTHIGGTSISALLP